MMTTLNVFPLFFGRNAPGTKLGDGIVSPIKLVRLQIEQQVNADFPLIHQVATTMTFLNNENRVLEGALEFTLPDTATICGYGLDVDGQIVDGVVVEKQAARIAFEKEVRKGIDPGFVELVGGNVFRTRVYPIRPRQTRIVRIIYQDQAVNKVNSNDLIFHVPMPFNDRLESLDIVLRCFGASTTSTQPIFINTSPLINRTYPNFVSSAPGNHVAEWHLTNVEPSTANEHYIAYALPDVVKPTMIAVESDPNVGAYFAISLALPSDVRINTNGTRSICILWDASLSRADALPDRILELNALRLILDHWLMKFGPISLCIVIFRNDMEETQYISYRSDTWSELEKHLSSVTYDGATNLAQLGQTQLLNVVTHYFLFSDCMSTMNHQSVSADLFDKLAAPIWIFNGSPAHQPTDHGLIRHLTERHHGGGYFNRNHLEQSSNELVALIDRVPLKYMGLRTSDSHVCHVYPSHGLSITSTHQRFLLVGQLSAPLPPSIQCELEFTLDSQICRVPFSCDLSTQTTDHFGLIRRQWAQRKLQELSAFTEKNRREITALGMEYSLVTDFTSLLVLETLQQHLQYRICPAQTRTKMYDDYLIHQRAENSKKVNKTDVLISAWNQYCHWYDRIITDIDRHRAFIPPSAPVPPPGNFLFSTSHNQPLYTQFPTGTAAPFGASGIPVRGTLPLFFGAAPTASVATSSSMSFAFGQSTQAQPSLFSATSAPAVAVSASPNTTQETKATITLHDNYPSTSSTNRLQSAATLDSAYMMYLNERVSFRQSPSFYFDMASFFLKPNLNTSALAAFNQQKNALVNTITDPKSIIYAIRILSNILELKLEAPQLLRTVLYKLMEIRRWDLAIDLSHQIYALRPDEPQSLYDLAVVSMALEKYQQAFNFFKQILDNAWDMRFNGIENIVLVDFNHLQSIMTKKDTSATMIDRQFIRYLPVDIRVVLEWDEPDTTLELSITEPTGQVCNMQRTQTDIGGSWGTFGLFFRASQPQQYVLRTAITGSYLIYVKLVSHSGQANQGATTALVHIYKHFGSDNEEKQVRAIRLTEIQQKIEIGSIEFGDSTLTKLEEELRTMKEQYARMRDELNGLKRPARSLVQHVNTTCDSCGSGPITGQRYKCLFCPNLDFCEECQLSSVTLHLHHDTQHPLICVRDSSLYSNAFLLLNRSAVIHSTITCSSCGTSPIVGTRYICTTCGIDICERCEFIGQHDPHHERVKISYPRADMTS